jgi:hypothetical protein
MATLTATRNGHASSQTYNSGKAWIPGTHIYSEWVLVTPDMAKEWLEANVKNRRQMPDLWKSYARDMTEGFWRTTHEGAAFDIEGNLIDAQHRLLAIVESGVSQWLLVTRNLSPEAIESINRGKVRTFAHILQIMGYKSNHRYGATARRMLFGPSSKAQGVTDSALRQFIDLNAEAIAFALSVIKPNVGPASVAGVVARAYYHSTIDKLTRFAEAMLDHIKTEDSQPGDKSARKLKTVSEANGHAGGSGGQLVLYRKAQNALYHYLNNIDVKKLDECSTDLFPIPKDKIPNIGSLQTAVS